MKKIPVHQLASVSHHAEFEIESWNDPVTPDMPQIPHRHNFHELLFLVEGEATHEIDFTDHVFTAGSIHFVGAQCVHLLKRKPDSIGFSIMFSPAFLPLESNIRLLDLVQTSRAAILSLTRQESVAIHAFIRQILEEYASDQVLKKEVLQSLFYALLLKLQRFTATSSDEVNTSRRHEFVEKLEHLLEQQFRSHWKVSQYAEALNMSVGNLSALCHKHFSMSAQQVINERVLLEIKRMLVYSDKPIKEICYELNFEDASYFNRFFKKSTGTTPMNYRSSTRIQ